MEKGSAYGVVGCQSLLEALLEVGEIVESIGIFLQTLQGEG